MHQPVYRVWNAYIEANAREFSSELVGAGFAFMEIRCNSERVQSTYKHSNGERIDLHYGENGHWVYISRRKAEDANPLAFASFDLRKITCTNHLFSTDSLVAALEQWKVELKQNTRVFG